MHGEERRVVALDPGQERDGDHRQPAEERSGPRPAGTGLAGWSRRTRRTSSSQPAAAASSGTATSGSNDQPRARLASVGGSAGIGPWAAASRAGEDRDGAAEPTATARTRRRRTRSGSHGARGRPTAMVARRARGTPRYDGRRLAFEGRPFACTCPEPPSQARVPVPHDARRGVMSTSPRKRPASEAIVAGGVVVLLIAIVGLVFWSGAGRTLYPPEAGHDAGPRDQQALRHRVRDRGRDLRRGRGPDRLERPALSPPAGRRRPSAADPRQQPRRGALDAHPDGHRPVPVRDLRGTPSATDDAAGPPTRRPRSRPSPASSSGSSSTWTRTATISPPRPARSGRTVVAWPCRSARTVYVTLDSGDVIHAWYVPQFLFKRDVVPGQDNHFEFRWTRTRPVRSSTASAPSCAARAIG